MDESNGQQNEAVQDETASESPNSTLADKICVRRFPPSKQHLVSIFDLLRSYEVVLYADIPIARLFEAPLVSSFKAEELSYMFSVGLLQEDGSYHLHIAEGNVVVKLSKFDHDFLSTTIPCRLADPKSYPSDIDAEISATELAIAQIASWKHLAPQGRLHARGAHIRSFMDLDGYIHSYDTVIQKTDVVLAPLSNRAVSLRDLQRTLPQHTATKPPRTSGTTPLATSDNPDTSRPIARRKRKSGSNCVRSNFKLLILDLVPDRGLPWTTNESGDLLGWFQQNQDLSQEAIEEQYYVDTVEKRSYASPQSKLYAKRCGHLSHNKKRASDKTHAECFLHLYQTDA
ncbi:hypothetical protein N7478_010094 [Penicillium angulare]|uniref:uncharacterized protein n=1 Tax=Penicillium angulare TaxID=116970 RepID=UPI0025411E2A|nr:uncharacterized protein N7478_010094 [Penicillium angulare]KAJ5267286.1 hypothetical protein N7478_010094 [Penicillium angulare]